MERSDLLAEDLRKYVQDKLRKTYVYVMHESIDRYALQCGQAFSEMIDAQ